MDAAVDATTEAQSPSDPCRVAAEHDLTYCQWSDQGMEYCEAAPESGVCPELSGPPQWVWDLLVVCVAECVVEIQSTDPVVDGSCCYLAYDINVGP